jgi:transposase-like protein
VKSSGVVGVDEKYVLVPKNDKPDGKMRRWMYVYLAVDVYTYDLLHIAVYAHNDKDTALTFLLALRAKGYQPRIVVTDLRRDYGPDIARVFPKAVHHECIFHALKDISTHCRQTYGTNYAEKHPQLAVCRRGTFPPSAIWGRIYGQPDKSSTRTARRYAHAAQFQKGGL